MTQKNIYNFFYDLCDKHYIGFDKKTAPSTMISTGRCLIPTQAHEGL